MKNHGRFDPTIFPVKSGGLTDDDIEKLEKQGWRQEKTQYDVEGADLGISDPDMPIPFLIRKFDIPAGTEYFYNPKTGEAVLTSCGNPTCWRHLM